METAAPDFAALLSAREKIHAAVARSDALVARDHRTRRIAADLTYVTANPETWEFAICLSQFANEEQRSPQSLFEEFELTSPQPEPSPLLVQFVDQYAQRRSVDGGALLRGATKIAGSGIETWDIGTVVVTTLEVCKSMCGDNYDCIVKCMENQVDSL